MIEINNGDPERIAVLDLAGAFSLAELSAAADVVADAMIATGRTGFVAVVCRPGFGWLAAVFGAWRAGCAVVPLEPSHPVADLAHPASDARVSAVLCSASTVELANALAAHVPESVVLCVDDVLAAHVHEPQERPQVSDSDDALVIYTSGTTGKPKGVVHTHRSVAAQISGMVEMWGWTSDDRTLCVLPLHHVHGVVNITLTSVSVGATLEAPGSFDAIATWERFASGELTVFMAVPTIYSRLVAAWTEASEETKTRWSLGASRLRLMVSGSAALPVSTLENWKSISGQVLLERYGMTELGMVLSNTLDERVPGHVGWPFPGVEVRLEDSGGLLVCSAQMFDRYLNRPDATAESFDGEWFRTGDVAVETDQGYRLLGRASVDIIKSGGEKVSALEIEEVFRTHEAIADCAVVGLPDEEWGQRVAMAWVGESDAVSADELRSWGKERLAPAKVPVAWLCVEELPRNAMGKVVKSEVTALFNSSLR